jgi:capsular polysaccharide biosynthesis protein
MTHGTGTQTPPSHLRRGPGDGANRSGLPPMDPPVPPPLDPPATGGNGGSWSNELYVRALRQWWWLPALTAVIAAGTAWVLTTRQTPQYAAAATAIVAPVVDLTESSELLRSLDTLERRTVVATFARLAGTREVRMTAAEHLGIAEPDVRGHRISASVVSSTNLIRLRAEGPDPQVAAALANAAVQVTEAEARRLYQIFSLHTVEAATPPVRPIHPDPQRNVGVGVVLGLFLGLLAAVGLEALRVAGRSPQKARVGT